MSWAKDYPPQLPPWHRSGDGIGDGDGGDIGRRTNKSDRIQPKGSTRARRYCMGWSFQSAQICPWNTKGLSSPRVSIPQDFFDRGTIMSDDPLHIGARRATRQPSPPRASARQHERPLLSSHRTAQLTGKGTTGALLATNKQTDKGRERRRQNNLNRQRRLKFPAYWAPGRSTGETDTSKVFRTAMSVNEVFVDLPLAARLRRTCATTLGIPRKPFPRRTSAALSPWQTPPSQHAPVPKPRRHRGNT